MPSMENRWTLTEADLANRFWVHDPTHLGFAMTPLLQSFMIPAVGEAIAHITRATGRNSSPREVRIYHGYPYDEVTEKSPEPDPAAARQRLEAMRPQFQGLRARFDAIVTNELLPAYEELEGWTHQIQTRADAAQVVESLVGVYRRIWIRHMEIVMPVFAVQELFEIIFLELFPDKMATDAHALLVGASNQFVETDRALAALAESARSLPTIRQVLMDEDAESALGALPEAQGFLQQLSQVLDRYGWRVGAGHDFYQKTWREDPRPALAVIRQFLQTGIAFETRWKETVAHQQSALQSVLAQLEPRDKAQFKEIFELASLARPIDEDHHFYIDAMLPAKSRALFLAIADLLLKDGTLAERDDIFFLYRDELQAMLVGEMSIDRDTLATRKVLYQQYYDETPPSTLGTPPWETVDEKAESTEYTLTGMAASAGTWEGTVRVIHGVEDFSRLEPGEVLVARTTMPSWSGLFATAGAVVTDSGGILSHAATVAREYRVPCVVATRKATGTLQDGDRVLVDGNQGTVHVIFRRNSFGS